MAMQGTGHPYKLLPSYEGMRPKDVAIWDTFTQNNPHMFDWVWYNVPVGDPVAHEQDRPEYRANGMDGVSFWRVDVVGFKGGMYYAVEVKPNAGAGAIGQALIYAAFLRENLPAGTKVWPTILTDDIAPITAQAAIMLRVIAITP